MTAVPSVRSSCVSPGPKAVEGRGWGGALCAVLPSRPPPLNPCSRISNACFWAGSLGGTAAAAPVENSGRKLSLCSGGV